MIKTINLSKKYGSEQALKDINIHVKKGDIYGLVGNNGAGKTSLMKILTGQCFPTQGQFELLGASYNKEKESVRKRMGTLVESPSFFPNMTVHQNLEYYRLQRGIPNKDRVDEVLSDVNLIEARKKKFKNLSLGMKQRLAIALALMGEPELLLLDEPINGLDPQGIIEIRKLLYRLNKERRITIVISSHILTELANLATSYGFLDRGTLVEEISAEALNERCRSYLEVRVTNTQKLAALLEVKLAYKDYKVLQDQTIHIFDSSRKAENVNKLAWENGIGVTSITEKVIDLESYYMELIGGTESA